MLLSRFLILIHIIVKICGEMKKQDFVPSSANAGLGNKSDYITSNVYSYLVEPLKTIDKKTDEDREKDREYYLKASE